MSISEEPSSTSQAGEKSSSNVLFDPWERITPANRPAPAAGEPKGTPAVKQRAVMLDPWERTVPKIKQKLNVSESEQALAQKVKLSPAEQARDEMINKSPENIAELRREIAKTTNPANRAILQDELNKLVPNGVIEQGNIDLNKRPVVNNSDGTISTVRSMGVNIDGEEVLIPTVSDAGKILSDDEAIKLYKKTGKHLGKFTSPEASDRYAEQLHKDQEKLYGKKK